MIAEEAEVVHFRFGAGFPVGQAEALHHVGGILVPETREQRAELVAIASIEPVVSIHPEGHLPLGVLDAFGPSGGGEAEGDAGRRSRGTGSRPGWASKLHYLFSKYVNIPPATAPATAPAIALTIAHHLRPHSCFAVFRSAKCCSSRASFVLASDRDSLSFSCA